MVQSFGFSVQGHALRCRPVSRLQSTGPCETPTPRIFGTRRSTLRADGAGDLLADLGLVRAVPSLGRGV
jgi:hypothetical protein